MTKREIARRIWQVAVDSVMPSILIHRFFMDHPEVLTEIQQSSRVLVVGCGKASAEMTLALEEVLADSLNKCEGLVNVPNEQVTPTKKIHLHGARPSASNFPTPDGVTGAKQMLALLSQAGPDDLAICLISGGGSALLPCPIDGVTLEDKLAVTKLLHQSGADITEMNTVRKHLSAVKGGRLAQAFRGKKLIGLILSDVIDDPLDVIASGPTTPDPSTYADAIAILKKYRLLEKVPAPVRETLEKAESETPKKLDERVKNYIVGNNAMALEAATYEAHLQGYTQVVRLQSNESGETQTRAEELVKTLRSCQENLKEPMCILSGGETTVTLGAAIGTGGRNQEYALAMLGFIGESEWQKITFLSAGTDGEDGPTNAAGAFADLEILQKAKASGLSIFEYLNNHDSYTFFLQTDGLLKTGLTGTNVMDVRVILLEPSGG